MLGPVGPLLFRDVLGTLGVLGKTWALTSAHHTLVRSGLRLIPTQSQLASQKAWEILGTLGMVREPEKSRDQPW